MKLGIPPWSADLDLWGRDVGGDGQSACKVRVQPGQPSGGRQRAMVRGALAVIVGMPSALVLTACGSSGNNSTPGLPTDITSETDTPITDEPFITDTPTTEEDTTEPLAAPTTMAAGERTTISTSDGSFDVVVGKPRGRATQPLTSNRWLGLPVTISGVTGRPIVSETNFGISPVASMGSDTGDVDAAFDLDSGSAGKTACAGMKSFSDVMDESNAEADPLSGYVLGSNFGTATFCLLFLYDASESSDDGRLLQ